MSQMMLEPDKGTKFVGWTPWVVIALVATVAGLLLPQLMPGDNVLSTLHAKTDAKDETKAKYTAPVLPEAPNFQAMLARLGGGTIVVLGLCVVTLWVIRRWVNPQPQAGVGPRALELKETLSLGNRCSLHLVQLGKREVLVGVDAAGIKVIVPLPHAFDDVLAQTEMPGAEETIPPRRLAA